MEFKFPKSVHIFYLVVFYTMNGMKFSIYNRYVVDVGLLCNSR